jgi:acetolactate synthase-1/3 small subunit
MLALYKVRTTPETRADIILLGEASQARVVDIGDDAVIFEVSGTAEKIDAMGERMKPFGIVEHVRTGIAAMTRASDQPEDPLAFDLTDLFVA